MAEGLQFIGKNIELITRAHCRYQGVLYEVKHDTRAIILKDVRCFGTEDRTAETFVEPSNVIREYVNFRGDEISDLHVVNVNDNAAQQQQQQAPPAPVPAPATQQRKQQAPRVPKQQHKQQQQQQQQQRGMPPPPPQQTQVPAQTAVHQPPAAPVNYSAAVGGQQKRAQPQQKQTTGALGSGKQNQQKPSNAGNAPSVPAWSRGPPTMQATNNAGGYRQQQHHHQQQHSQQQQQQQQQRRGGAQGYGRQNNSRQRGPLPGTGDSLVNKQLRGATGEQKQDMSSEFDFIAANQQFNKDTEPAQAAASVTQLPTAKKYNSEVSFFDDLSCDALEPRRGAGMSMNEEKKKNSETFGAESVHTGRRNNYYNRGRGRGRGNSRNYHNNTTTGSRPTDQPWRNVNPQGGNNGGSSNNSSYNNRGRRRGQGRGRGRGGRGQNQRQLQPQAART